MIINYRSIVVGKKSRLVSYFLPLREHKGGYIFIIYDNYDTHIAFIINN